LSYAKLWMTKVRTGQQLSIKPLWNQTERKHNQLPVPCEIVGVEVGAASQSGFLFDVHTNSGFLRRLDAAWFQEPSK
jgi:hypothetical protein